jgi:hypothetical protein
MGQGLRPCAKEVAEKDPRLEKIQGHLEELDGVEASLPLILNNDG